MNLAVKFVVEEDFVNYKKPSMFIGFPNCTFKCDQECGMTVCQNSPLAKQPSIWVDAYDLVERYIRNPITESIVIGGLEPFDDWSYLATLINLFRIKTLDDIVIYTGYNKDEINGHLKYLSQFKNIIIKYGRFIPNHKPHKDEVLGINLASDNQYAERIS